MMKSYNLLLLFADRETGREIDRQRGRQTVTQAATQAVTQADMIFFMICYSVRT